MSIKLIQDKLNSYNCQSEFEEEHAIREITQEVVLAALGRTVFFKQAVFQGGTCLRIFYGLNRFSEDLDFILREPDRSFMFEPYLSALSDELNAYGYNIEIMDRSKAETNVKKAFIKDDSIGKVLQVKHVGKTGPFRKIRIKFEVDTNPPSGSDQQISYLDFPFVSSVTTQDLPSLFAGKIHALLCREYTKGRDWYDFIWYAGRETGINYAFLASALKQQGPWQGKELNVDKEWCIDALGEKICSLNWQESKDDIRRFVRQNELASIELWDQELFLDRLEKHASKIE
jgi:predicted nucleotidyltransferase component of viral defense system